MENIKVKYRGGVIPPGEYEVVNEMYGIVILKYKDKYYGVRKWEVS